MKFSVAIPAYRPDFFVEALDSVVSQTWQDWELVVVDDCSPSDLRSLVLPFLKDSRVHFYRNDRNFGALDVVDNWNRCLEYCSGDYVICMGDDDRLLPGCLAALAELIRKHPGLGVYHSRTQIIDAQGNVKQTLEERPELESSVGMIRARWAGRSQYIGDFCFDASLLKKNGGFIKFPLAWGSDDISAYIAAKGDGPDIPDGIANCNEPGFQYRESGITISSGAVYRQKLESLLSCADWFRADFLSRGEDTAELEAKFRDFAEYYVRKDASVAPGAVFYWLKRRKATRLGAMETIWLCMKGMITRR